MSETTQLPISELKKTVTIYPNENSIKLADEQVIRVKRRWVAMLLAMLVAQARTNRDVSAEMLRIELERRGQTQPLDRTQHRRLVNSARELLDLIPDCTARIDCAAGKETVGPWRLRCDDICEFQIDDGNLSSTGLATASKTSVNKRIEANPDSWPWPLLLAVHDIDTLRRLLAICVLVDGYAICGKFHDAIKELEAAHALPLSDDARAMLTLRDACFHKRIGEFDEARMLALNVATASHLHLRDPALRDYAKFLLDRIAYDESPGSEHTRLWELAHTPEPVIGMDLRTGPEWHNLRALLARRRLLASAEGGTKIAQTNHCLHRHALLHLETAIYWTLAVKDWDKLQAFVANIAFHLQEVAPLDLVTIPQVFAWHMLEVEYDRWFDAGKDAAWEYVFLGEFWLDHEAELRAADHSGRCGGDPFSVMLELHPAHESFYLHALERLKSCADNRQVALAKINYLRFARRHLGTKKQQSVFKSLSELLRAIPQLWEQLHAEGYGAYLPPHD